jgi:transcriptional regulator with XRE-family HTH domain
MSSPKDDITTELRTARRARHITQQTLARLAGVGTPHISDIENKRVTPRLATLLDVARALDFELLLVPKPLVPAVRALKAHEQRSVLSGSSKSDSLYLLNASEDD